jgi:hypothetical protein
LPDHLVTADWIANVAARHAVKDAPVGALDRQIGAMAHYDQTALRSLIVNRAQLLFSVRLALAPPLLLKRFNALQLAFG